MHFRKSGFTLIELMIVLAIIGILAGALLLQVGKAGDSARAMRCKANLRNLAQAAMTHGLENRGIYNFLPYAGSYEYADVGIRGGHSQLFYSEMRGWVNWTGRPPGSFPNPSPGQTAKFYADSDSGTDLARVSITNGTLWGLMGRNFSSYVCDEHKKAGRRNNVRRVVRSYVMNGYFGYDKRGRNQKCAGIRGVSAANLSDRGSAGNLLLFAELPIYKPGSGTPHKDDFKTDYDAGGPCWADGVLETYLRSYKPQIKVNPEYIGFNHLVANRYVAHVVFADGHVEALVEPDGASTEDLEKLTESLCNGDEIDEEIRSKMH